jgi:hypothetical protein
MDNSESIWNFLREGEYISHFLYLWYANGVWASVVTILSVFLVVFLVLLVLTIYIMIFFPNNPGEGAYRWKLLLYLCWYVLSIVICGAYLTFLWLIRNNPNILVVNDTVQHLTKVDFVRFVNFLYRFFILGIFAVVFNVTTAFQLLSTAMGSAVTIIGNNR